MKIDKIKPIPKYIIALIRKYDNAHCRYPSSITRYYAYLTQNDGELVKVTVAVKNYYKKWYCKQVVVHGLNSKDCFLKDIAFNRLAGYITGWYAEGINKFRKWFEDGQWGEQDDNMFDMEAPVINMDYLKRYPEYKYSQIENYTGDRVLQYLRLYKQFPQMEYLMKLGLKSLVMKKTILKKVSSNKPFRTWLIQHRNEINCGCYAETVLTAFKTKKSIPKTQAYLVRKKHIEHLNEFGDMRKLFRGNYERLFSYIDRQQIDIHTYNDYIRACIYLNTDLADVKNLFPHDFRRWHNERIEQAHILREAQNRKAAAKRKREQKQLEKDKLNCERNFLRTVKKYMSLQTEALDGFVVFIAQSPADLIREGIEMSHCVGGENYRLKMSKGKTLIFFVRKADEPDKAYITLEYSPTGKNILQCYAYDNTPPEKSALEFVKNKWLPYANNTVNKIQRRKAA